MFIFAIETTGLTVRRDATRHGSSQCAHDDDETAGAEETTTATATQWVVTSLTRRYLPTPLTSLQYALFLRVPLKMVVT